MGLFCSSCNFPKFSLQSHRKFSISEPFTTKRVFINFPSSLISKPSIFFNFNPSLQIPHCCTSSSSNLSQEPSKEIPPKTIIFIRGLAKSTSQGSLETAFSRFGDVSRVKIITDKKTGKSLGFAYVWFSSEEFALRAVAEMNGQFFEGRFISVTTARHGSCKTPVKQKPYKF